MRQRASPSTARRARRSRSSSTARGYGTDGTLWGGELLHCDLESFERLAWLDPVPLPGGEAAIREPWRVAAAHLEAAGLPVPWERWRVVRESLKANAPLSSGMGRLFDAVAAVLGVRERISYEGQAAIELEQLAGDTTAEPWAWRFGATTELVAECYLALERGSDPGWIAASFHETVAAAAAAACVEVATCNTVVLSGGTFQNLRLLDSTRAAARGGRLPRPHPPARPAQRRRDQFRTGRDRCT